MVCVAIADSADVVVTGAGSVTKSGLSEAPSDWESYEGTLLTLSNVTVTADSDTYGEATTDWAAPTDKDTAGVLTIDDMFYSHNSADGTVYQEVTGVLNYTYTTWKLEPRDADDLVTAR